MPDSTVPNDPERATPATTEDESTAPGAPPAAPPGDLRTPQERAPAEERAQVAPYASYRDINSAGGNVTDGLAIHDAIRQIVRRGTEVTIVVQGMAYSMGSVVLQAASPGRRLSLPHSWIMIHEPAKWAGWQSTSAAAQHLDRLKQMQTQIYEILAKRSGKPLQKIIRDTKVRT